MESTTAKAVPGIRNDARINLAYVSDEPESTPEPLKEHMQGCPEKSSESGR